MVSPLVFIKEEALVTLAREIWRSNESREKALGRNNSFYFRGLAVLERKDIEVTEREYMSI